MRMRVQTLFLIIFLMLISGCTETNGLPRECVQHVNDECALFECLTDECWCDNSVSSAILYQDGILVGNERQAETIAMFYIQDSEEYKEYTTERTVQLNEFFYNVFLENADGDEIFFTVSSTGKLLKTVCGI